MDTIDWSSVVWGALHILGWVSVVLVVAAAVFFAQVWFSDSYGGSQGKSVPPQGFKGKRIVIVGASTGIGRALALRLARDGAHLVVASRSKDKLLALAKECKAAGSPRAVALELDALDLESHASFAERAARELDGPIDVLVNNAGRSQRSLAEDTDLKVTRDMLELNVIAPISLTKAFLPSMLERGSGHIFVTSSVAGKVGAPCSSSYAATKYAVQGYFSALRNEVAYRGVDVTLVCPGPVESEITKHAFTAKDGVVASAAGFAADHSKRMTAERCAELMAVAIYHRLYEIWVGPQPVLLFTVLSQFLPQFSLWLAANRVGPARTKAMMSGRPGYESIQSVSGVLFGAGKQ